MARDNAGQQQRIYALDWLRSGAFILLLFFHSALLFTPYGWHLSLDTLPSIEGFVEFCRPWRMPLIFLVSGAALSFSFQRRGAWAFGIQTLKRLLPPLIFGMFVLIPPVLYIENLDGNREITFWQSYKVYLQNFAHGDFRWLHLWYLGYLLAACGVATVAWTLLAGPMQKIRDYQVGSSIPSYLLLIGMSLPIVIAEASLRPHFPIQRNFFSDIASLATFFIVFTYGATLIRNRSVLALMAKYVWHSLVLGCLFYVLSVRISSQFQYGLEAINLWMWILFFTGLTYRYCNRQNRWIESFNNIVFPFYLIHQLIILIVAYLLSDVFNHWWLYISIVGLSFVLSVMLVKLTFSPATMIHSLVGMQKA